MKRKKSHLKYIMDQDYSLSFTNPLGIFQTVPSRFPTYHSLLAAFRKENPEAVSGWVCFILPENQWLPWESLVSFWEFAISAPDPCCLHPEGCDLVENDLPAQHIPYLGNEHCVFAFPSMQEENHRPFPNLKQMSSSSQGGYPAFPLLRIASDAILELSHTPCADQL